MHVDLAWIVDVSRGTVYKFWFSRSLVPETDCLYIASHSLDIYLAYSELISVSKRYSYSIQIPEIER